MKSFTVQITTTPKRYKCSDKAGDHVDY